MDDRDKLHLAIAVLVLGLVGSAYWLFTEMHRRGKLEECLMARRRDCAQYASP